MPHRFVHAKNKYTRYNTPNSVIEEYKANSLYTEALNSNPLEDRAMLREIKNKLWKISPDRYEKSDIEDIYLMYLDMNSMYSSVMMMNWLPTGNYKWLKKRGTSMSSDDV